MLSAGPCHAPHVQTLDSGMSWRTLTLAIFWSRPYLHDYTDYTKENIFHREVSRLADRHALLSRYCQSSGSICLTVQDVHMQLSHFASSPCTL